ncbi:metallophosphoesterase family protein [Sulfitobacter albidus]|uniref:Metallophosphoesterase family protein n=1 Tax=Sulfitobacter albidus TaxID=2829501 RepID=A0A975JFX3_9RHOB|nr:metallophosphoesterase family protein [Sulfitobacter albidus]QUJ77530.1 metallophosphoesterase family protein [Sulfitobacter albidus]
MRHRDLGVLEGDVLVFGGPYSNAQATQALLARARELAIPGDRMICTGDTVAYCGGARETVAALRDSGCAVLAGNCEIQLAQDAEDCGCGFADGSACDLLSNAWYAHARAVVPAADKAWMADLPGVITFEQAGKRFGVLHGGMRDVAQFIWETDEDALFAREWAALERAVGPVDAVIAGHCGLPFLRLTARGAWMNAGVIGMPPHDGDPATRYGVLSDGQMRIERLSYDHKTAMAEMRAAFLPPAYHDALQSGYWPSEDVLPDPLRVPVSDRG